jgi:two-component system NtrC family sensor kinase
MKEDLQAVSRKLLSGEIEPVEFYENPVLTKSGEERLIAWHNTVLRDERGNIIGHLSSGEDITERKRAEETVRESEEKLRKMFESVTDGIIVVNLDGIITEVNQRAVELYGASSRDELLGKSAFELVAPRDHERIAKNMRQALKGGIIQGVEYTLLKAGGTEFPAELSTSVLKDASGKAIGHITISRDITERQEAEERELELQRELNLASRLAAVGELAAGVAHEMNNPLTGIMGFSERLLRRSGEDETRETVDIIHREAQRLAKVVKNLLTFARQREPTKEFADINDIVQKTLELRAYELKSSNIEVALDLPANLPQIMVDFHQIQEVFLNIILNAEQVMTEASGGGKLTIKSRPIKDYIRISFADDGPGIPAEHLDRVFNPFFTTKGGRGGTGVGLSVCHGIVTEHGGRIYARSKPGSGATFLVDLPLTNRKIGESQIEKAQLSI